jgi:hypothetical protein
MRIFLWFTGPSRTTELLVSVHPTIYNGKTHHRNFISFNKIRQIYQNYWKPPPPKPPYLHICQIGDPVLRGKATPVEPNTIKSPEIQKVRKQIITNEVKSLDSILFLS